MFADDTTLFSTSSTLTDCEAHRDDLKKCAVWLNTWLLNINATKCVVLKIRQIFYTYALNGYILEVVKEQNDLNILTPNKLIGLIKRCFESTSENIIKTLYESMIRSVLDHASPALNP